MGRAFHFLLAGIAGFVCTFFLAILAWCFVVGDTQLQGAAIGSFATLIGTAGAVTTALIALAPVKQQLREVGLQSAVMSRGVVQQSIELQGSRRHSANKLLAKMIRDALHRYHFIDAKEVPEWAFHTDSEFSSAANALDQQGADRSDLENTARARAEMIRSLEHVAQCLSDIHYFHSGDSDDFTESEWKEIERKSVAANEDIADNILLANAAHERFDEAFAADIDRLRERLRELDRTIIGLRRK